MVGCPRANATPSLPRTRTLAQRHVHGHVSAPTCRSNAKNTVDEPPGGGGEGGVGVGGRWWGVGSRGLRLEQMRPHPPTNTPSHGRSTTLKQGTGGLKSLFVTFARQLCNHVRGSFPQQGCVHSVQETKARVAPSRPSGAGCPRCAFDFRLFGQEMSVAVLRRTMTAATALLPPRCAWLPKTALSTVAGGVEASFLGMEASRASQSPSHHKRQSGLCHPARLPPQFAQRFRHKPPRPLFTGPQREHRMCLIRSERCTDLLLRAGCATPHCRTSLTNSLRLSAVGTGQGAAAPPPLAQRPHPPPPPPPNPLAARRSQ